MPAFVALADTTPDGVLLDQSGNVRPGVSIWVYATGTSNPITLFTTSDATVTLAQPVTTDQNGQIPGYAISGQTVDFYDPATGIRKTVQLLAVADITALATQEENDAAALDAAIAALTAQIGPPPGVLPPTNIVPPTITGTVSAGSVLTCNLGTWGNTPTGYAFQWFLDATTPISGAVTQTYTVQAGDTSHAITCQVTASNAAGSVIVTSNSLSTAGSSPVNTVAPVASGTMAAGNVLTCSQGSWTSTTALTFSYSWVSGNTIVGTGAAYTVQNSDLAAPIFCAVTATNSYGSATIHTNFLYPPAGPPTVAPVNTTPPTISGTVAAGDTLTCDPGGWSNAPTQFVYQWYADTLPLSDHGAKTSTYIVQSADTSHLITCQVTAANSAGAATATSNGLLASGNAPVNTVAPVASGTVATGDTVSVDDGTWINGVTSYAFQWTRNGVPITSGTGYATSSYTVQSADLTATLVCDVTASNAYGATTQASNPLTAAPSGATVLWTGNKLASYPITYLYDPSRAYDTKFDGFNCVALYVLNTDTISTTGARAMIDSPSNIMTYGNRYICGMDVYLPSANFPNGWTGWCMFDEQAYGPPFKGSPNLNLMSSDGKNWGPKLGSGVVDAQAPILYDQWNTWVYEFDLSKSAFFQVTLNGTVIYASNNYPIISAADSTGPWEWHLGIYHQYNIGGGAQFGPMYLKNVYIATPGSGPSGSAPTNSVAPTISGTVSNGSKLTVSNNGTWSNSPTGYSYQWRANGSPLSGATASTYAVTSTTASANIDCLVTATNAYGSNTADSNTLTGTGATVQPNGISGTWNLVFDDEFTGTSYDSTKWNADGYTNNGMSSGSSSANVSVGSGVATLVCPKAGHGAQLVSITQPLAVGNCIEFRANFSPYNWPAVWTSSNSGSGWPHNGEVDVCELLGGGMSDNYHYYSSGNQQAGPFFPSGTWTGGYHTYGMKRTLTQVLIYWDGVLQQTISTNDSGLAHNVYITCGDGNTSKYDSGGELLVDYVRVWSPAS